jgi:hypothetical protein
MKTVESLVAQKSGKHSNRHIRSRSQKESGTLSRVALDFLLSETITFLLVAGFPRKSLASELRRVARGIVAGSRLRRPKSAKVIREDHENLVEIGGVVHDWHRQAAYTNPRSGEPRPLSLAELRRLIGQRFPRQRIARALRWMTVNGIVRRRKSGLFAISTGRHLVLSGERELVLERAAALVPQYLRTSLRNAHTPHPQSRDIDRDARVFFLPEKWVGLWREVARERTEAFLEGVDNWLEDHTRPDDSGPLREVAIHCYGFTGEPRTPKPSGTNIGRLEGVAR